MKTKKLKSPFSWHHRRVLLQERILFVPDYCDNYQEFLFPGWGSSELFGNDNPVYVEYCSGNGAWIASQALAAPEINWVAVEKKFERARKIWNCGERMNLKNLFVICGEGCRATQLYFPSESLSNIYINFPDPWPKNKHAKHRLIHPQFVSEMWRCLRKEAMITMVTDDADYSGRMIEAMGEATSCYPSPFYVTEHQGYGASFFGDLWTERGKEIRYHKFRKEGLFVNGNDANCS